MGRKKYTIDECDGKQLSYYIYETRKSIKRAEKCFSPDSTKIGRLQKECSEYEEARRRWYEKHPGPKPFREWGSRDNDSGISYISFPDTDARIAEELGYPPHIVQSLIDEPNADKRQDILRYARVNF